MTVLLHGKYIRSALNNISLLSQALSNSIDITSVTYSEGKGSDRNEGMNVVDPSDWTEEMGFEQ